MKISGQLLKKIIKEETMKVLEQEGEISSDAEKASQAISKASGFEQKIQAINNQKELEDLLQFMVSKLDPKKMNAQVVKRSLKTIFDKL